MKAKNLRRQQTKPKRVVHHISKYVEGKIAFPIQFRSVSLLVDDDNKLKDSAV